MLFKLVVITVLVIAESSDTCIKTVRKFYFNIFALHGCHLFSLFADMGHLADPAKLQGCTNSSSCS